MFCSPPWVAWTLAGVLDGGRVELYRSPMAGRDGGLSEGSPAFFYGWWIVVACFVSMSMAGGIGNLSFPVFLKPLTAEFGWSRAEVSGGISAFMLAIALTAPFVGRAVGLYGPRAVMIPAAVLVGLCLMLLSQLTALWQLYLLRLGVGVGFTALAHVPVNIAISRWFTRKRGRAMGTAMIGAPVGGLLMTPFASACIEWVDWRLTLLILGGLLWLILVPVLFGLLRDTPADLGLLPDGETRRPSDDMPVSTGVGEGISARDTLRTGRFWALIGIYFLAYGCLFSVMIHQHPYFTDQGFSAQHAALLVSVLLSASVISGLGFGWASERYDPMQLAAACYALGGVGIALLLWASPVVAVVGFVVCFGLFFGGTTPLTALVTGHMFGMKAHGVIYGFYQTVICLSGFVGPTVMGFIYDTTGSYQLGFTGVSIGLLCAAALMLVVWARTALLPVSVASA